MADDMYRLMLERVLQKIIVDRSLPDWAAARRRTRYCQIYGCQELGRADGFVDWLREVEA